MNKQTDVTQLEFVGLCTTIKYDQGKEAWGISKGESNITGISKAYPASYALGRHNWTIYGDKTCSEDSPSYTTELKLSGCKDGNFTCNDGQCIKMSQRCDQLPDCRDKSDERNCDILVLEDGYNKNVVPVPIVLDHSKRGPVNVSVSLDLLKLVNIDEPSYSIEIQFEIVLQWKENRATFQNLKPNTSLNALTQKDIEKLWLPKVIYENTNQKETTRLGTIWEWETYVVVKREGNFTRSGPDTLDEVEVFKGVENSLIMSQTYTHKFQCSFILTRYPFDKQTCSIDMTMETLVMTSVTLIPDRLVMSQQLDMHIFKITDWSLHHKTDRNGNAGLRMDVVLKRKIVSEMMTTYFPSILLTAITFATTFFKPFFFEAALSVNLTTMLVMTTIFISKMEVLPPTSDIKMIDIWLILCQMVPFAEVVLLTAREYHREDENEEVEESMEKSNSNKSWIPVLRTLGE